MMTQDISIDIQLALDWLVESGIQDSEGGFYGWYSAEKGGYSFLYPEITGYAIQLFCKLQKHDSTYLKIARKAGDWLLKIQGRDGSFYCKDASKLKDPWRDTSFYVFDGAIITNAMLSLHKVTLQERYLRAALKTTELILTLQNADGSFQAGWDRNGIPIDYPHWSQTSACHHLKMLIPLLRLHKLTSNRKILNAAKRLLNWGVNLQISDGSFLEFAGSPRTYTHAHCYAVEGLLGSMLSLQKDFPSIESRVDSAIEWLSYMQNDDGSFYNWNSPQSDRIKVTESLAQSLRLFMLSGKHYLDHGAIDKQLHRGFSYLKKMQLQDNDKQINGAISYGESRGRKLKDACTCATIFALDATLISEWGFSYSFLDEIL